jgi:hypothetical protein
MNTGMKKLITVGLLAISSLAATAATMKTSKATPLSSSQMESIKGAGTMVVFVWTGYNWNSYTQQYQYWDYAYYASYDTGMNGPNGRTNYGGPNPGTWFY